MSEESTGGSALRLYSDFILFNCNRGRFAEYPLLSSGRKKGVRELLGDRIDNLDTDRRLRPVDVYFTAGAKPHKIYMIASVREEVSEEQLTNLLDKMNDMVTGKDPDEQEAVVRELIRCTGTAVRPGMPYLPQDYAKEGQDKAEKQRDDADRTVLESDEEVVGMVESNRASKRSNKDPPLPPTSSKLPAPRTDDESVSPTRKKLRTKSPIPAEKPSDEKEKEAQPEATEYQIAKHPSHNEDDTDSPPPLESPEEGNQDITMETSESHRSVTADEVIALNESVDTMKQELTALKSEVSQNRDKYVKVQDFGAFCKDLIERFEKFEEHVRYQMELRQAAGISSGDSGTPATVMQSQPSSDAPAKDENRAVYNSVENELMAYFPINVFTEDMMWLLEQPIVQDFLRKQVMVDLYDGNPKGKAPPQDAIYGFIDNLFSQRFQSHIGNPVARRARYDFGRMPCPKIAYKILHDKIMPLARPIADGLRQPGQVIKDKCCTLHTKQVLGSSTILGCESVEEVAYYLYWERYDFYCQHQWLFPKVDPDNPPWTYETEISKVMKLKAYKNGKLDHDDKFSFKDRGHPEDIEAAFWPMLVKGRIPQSRKELEDLVKRLNETGLSNPQFSRSVWKMINEPGSAANVDVQLGIERKKKLKKTRKRRNAKRRKSADEKSVVSGRSRKSGASRKTGRRKTRANESSSSESSSDSEDSSSDGSSSSDESDDATSRAGRSKARSRSEKSGHGGRSGRDKTRHKRDASPRSGKSKPDQTTTQRPALVAPVLVSPSHPGQLGHAIAPTVHDLFGTESSSTPSNGTGMAAPLQTLPVQEAPDVSLSNISVEGLNINLEDITPEMLSNLVVQPGNQQQQSTQPLPVTTADAIPADGKYYVIAEAPPATTKTTDIVNMAINQSNILAPGGPPGTVSYTMQGSQDLGVNVATAGQVIEASSGATVQVSGTVKKSLLKRYEEGEDILASDLTPSDNTTSNGTSSSSNDINILDKSIKAMDRSLGSEMPPPKSSKSRDASGRHGKGKKSEPKHKSKDKSPKKDKKKKRR